MLAITGVAMERLTLAALLLAAAANVSAGDGPKLPKKPDRPFAVAVTAVVHPAPSSEAENRAAKEVSDSIADLQNSIRDKRKDWFSLVTDPEQAEIILEIDRRAPEAGHGTVLRGRTFVLEMKPFEILGQGDLNPNSLDFRIWRQAASDMTQRLQVFCQKTYDDISKARKLGIRPLAVVQNDQGVKQLKADKFDEAIASLGEAIRLAPSFALPRFNRGLAFTSKKDYDHAIADFDEAIRLDPGQAKTYLFRGLVYRELGKTEPARADFDEAIRIDPKDGEAHLARGRLLRSLGDDRGSLPELDQAVALSSAKGEALAERGSTYAALGEKDKALLDLDAALGDGYRTSGVYYRRGHLLSGKDDAAACESFEQAVRLDKANVDALFERGICNHKNGLTSKAIDDFSEVIRLKPDRAEAWWNRGLCYVKTKQTRLANADRLQALKLDPGLARKK
jgi:tetratricopeptide (TPR) repeat protein